MPTPAETSPLAPCRLTNRRVTVRYRCAPATAGKVFTHDDQEFQRAWVDNLSKGGVGLFLSKPIPDGGSITVHLKSAVQAEVFELPGHVIHSTLREPYGWYVGIEFNAPISDEILDAIL